MRLRHLLCLTAAVASLASAVQAQTVAPLTVKDGSGATQTLCEFKPDGTNLAGCQVKYVWNGSAWVLEPADTAGHSIVQAPLSPTITGPTSTLTLTATTTAYTANQLIASSATAASVVVPSFSIANSGGGASIPRVRLSTNDATATAWGGVQVQVDLWSAAPTFTNGDRAAFVPATGTANHLGTYICTMSAEYGDGAYAECSVSPGGALIKLASGSSVFWTLQALSASGVTGASKVFTLTAEVGN